MPLHRLGDGGRPAERPLPELDGALKHPDPSDAKDDAEILKRLVAAERAWIAFRDADCDLQSISALGGTEEALAFSVCRYAMTKARMEALDTARKSR